jgi:hypothetical protein
MAKHKVQKVTPRQKGTMQWKIRIKPEMVDKLERSAKERGISINAEMVERLRMSFESGTMLSQWQITEDMKVVWTRFGDALLDRDQFQKTVRAAYFLIKTLPPEMQKTAAVTELMKELAASDVSFRRTAGGDK